MDEATNPGATATDTGQSTPEVGTDIDALSDAPQTSEIESPPETPETAPVEDEFEEIDWEDGKKYKVPKAISPALMRQRDYTKKTQEIAEQRRAHEAEAAKHKQAVESFAAYQKRHQESLDDVKEIYKIDTRFEQLNEQLAQYDKVDWDKWTLDDPERANAAWRRRELLKEQRDGLTRQRAEKERAIQDRWDKATREAEEASKRSQENAHQVLAKAIPKWSPETSAEITKYAVSNFGYTPKDLAGITDPRHVVTLYYARLGKMAEQKLRGQNPNPAQSGQPQQKPITSVAGNASSKSGTPRDDMPIDDWWKAELKRQREKGLIPKR